MNMPMKNKEIIQMNILVGDLHYLRKLIMNGREKIDKNIWKTRDEKPLNDVWVRTLEANKRLCNSVDIAERKAT